MCFPSLQNSCPMEYQAYGDAPIAIITNLGNLAKGSLRPLIENAQSVQKGLG